MKLKRWLFVLGMGLFFALPTFAQTPLPMVLSEECRVNGTCDVAEFYGLVARTANFMLALVGALLLIMFVYGGFWLIISGGSAERISKAKEVFVGSVIGLILVFGGYTIVNSVLGVVLLGSVGERGVGGSTSSLVSQFGNINNAQVTTNTITNQGLKDEAAKKVFGCCDYLLQSGDYSCQGAISQYDCETKYKGNLVAQDDPLRFSCKQFVDSQGDSITRCSIPNAGLGCCINSAYANGCRDKVNVNECASFTGLAKGQSFSLNSKCVDTDPNPNDFTWNCQSMPLEQWIKF